jgi:hypothetical protein
MRCVTAMPVGTAEIDPCLRKQNAVRRCANSGRRPSLCSVVMSLVHAPLFTAFRTIHAAVDAQVQQRVLRVPL